MFFICGAARISHAQSVEGRYTKIKAQKKFQKVTWHKASEAFKAVKEGPIENRFYDEDLIAILGLKSDVEDLLNDFNDSILQSI